MDMINQKAIWIATVFGPFLTIVGLWMLLRKDALMKTYSSIKGTPCVLYVRSTCNIFLGLLIINLYNMWMSNAFLLVTLLGWGFLVRGVVTLFAPQFAVKAGMSDQKVLRARGIIPLVWGLLLMWLAFWR
ncbi:MAG: hypothetical protein HYX48_00155 [Chlamydiales bacterium]|nr:hypothetical protein [Chlamydiales bacterium]